MVLSLPNAPIAKSARPPQKITFGELREMGIRGVLICCADYRCNHSGAVMADQWADDIKLGCRISRTVSPARSAAREALTFGQISTGMGSRSLRWAIGKVPAALCCERGECHTIPPAFASMKADCRSPGLANSLVRFSGLRASPRPQKFECPFYTTKS
jgi:hypothetical protein